MAIPGGNHVRCGLSLRCVAVFLLAWAAGCNKAGPDVGEVDGQVTLNGKPLPKVVVEFLPDPLEGTIGPRSTGTTDAEGRYSLKLDNVRAGAVIGNHRVVIRDLLPFGDKFVGRGRDKDKTRERDTDKNPGKKADTPKRPALPRIDARLSDAAKTPLRREVKPGRQTINLELAPSTGK